MSPGRSHPGEECALLAHPCHGNGTPPPPRTTAAGPGPAGGEKGGGGYLPGPRGHTSAALVATATGGVAKCAVAKQQRVLLGTPYSPNSTSKGLWTGSSEGSWGVPGSVLSHSERKGSPGVPESLAPGKGSPCRQPVLLPPQNPRRALVAGS